MTYSTCNATQRKNHRAHTFNRKYNTSNTTPTIAHTIYVTYYQMHTIQYKIQ